jgi:hypothetical protein
MQLLNREAYLNYITDSYIRPHFTRAGYTIPDNVRMSCSLTSRKKHIGECWSSIASEDNTFEIFIAPKIADSNEVIAILIHELIHATVGLQAGHGKEFKQCALSVGLQGKMTSTTASPDLEDQINIWIAESGNYPHAPLTQSNIKKQSTRQIKCVCLACDYQVYTSRKWLDIAMPTCPNDSCDQMGYEMNLG